MADANIRAVITAKDDASSVLNNFSNAGQISFGKLAGAFAAGQAIFVGVENVLRDIGNVISDVVSKAEHYQDAEVGLQTALNNNVTATDKSIDSLLKQASALSKVTGFSDQQYVAADNLLAIHKLNQAQIASLVPHIADMAQGLANATGEMPDLTQATQLVSKALGENDASGLSASLKRAGIALTDNQMEILKTGDMSQKLGTITDLLAGHFKGLSTADQASIKMAIFKDQISKAEETIGQALLPTISRLATKFATFVESDQFQAWLQKVAQWLGDNLPKIMDWITNTGIPDFIIAWDNIVVPIAKVVAAVIDFGAWVGKVVGDVAYDVTTIQIWFERLPANISGTAMQIWSVMTKAFGDIYNYIAGIVQGIINLFTGIPGAVGKAIGSVGSDIKGTLHSWHIPGFASGVENFSGGLAYVHQGEVLTNLPPGTNVIPKDKVGLGSNSIINITVQAGAFMGNPADARAYARLIFDHLKDVAGAKNMTVAEMLGA